MKLLQLLRMVALEILTLMLSSVAAVNVDLSLFSSELQQLTDGQLGIKQFQSIIDDQREKRLSFLNWLPDGQLLAEQISGEIEETVQRYVEAVRRIQTAYRNGLIVDDIRLDLCCNLSNLVYDPRFKRAINNSTVCHLTQSHMNIDIAVKNAMIDNLEKLPNTKWQFYGTEAGLHCTYPARNMCSELQQFDPRVRAWYTTTLNTPRDIVILIDRSRSMGDRYGDSSTASKFSVAKKAAAALVQFLNSNDRVAVLAFSDTVLSANSTSCFSRELAVGSEDNKNQLLQFITVGLGVDYRETRAAFEVALKAAYNVFKTTESNTTSGLYSDSEKIIVLLTDVNQKEDCQQIRQLEMDLFNDTVNIFPMGIGESVESDFQKESCLQSLKAGPRGAQGFVPNTDFSNLRSQLGFYYNAFNDRIDRTNVTFSVPFTDVNGLGLHTAACLPLFLSNGDISGVACVEFSVDDIFHEIVNFRIGQLSYGFVVDRRGRVILHPLLPQPTYWLDEPTLLELTKVEISEYSSDIEKQILSGQPGNRTVSNVRYYTAAGQSDLHGVIKFVKKATYFWNVIPSMKFFMCLVIIEREMRSNVTWNSTLSDVLLSDSDKLEFTNNNRKCVFFGRLSSTTGKSVVKLAPKTFIYPVNYTERTISQSEISQLRDYIIRTGAQPPYLSVKSGIRDVVAATSLLESIWLGSKGAEDLKQHIVSRYIGTKEGVYRRYPAIPIAQDFDPTIQPWYKTASVQPKQTTFALPCFDSASRVPIISISKTVWNRRVPNSPQSDQVMGVIGMDVTAKYLYRLLVDTIDQCSASGQECFAIDLSGFLVIHKDFQMAIPTGSLHIAAREEAIASELMEKNILTADTCINYAELPLTKRLFWKTDILYSSCQELRTCVICKLKYGSDVSTNLFLIVKLPSDDSSPKNCACQNQTDGKYRCAYDLTSSINQCQCPCNLTVDYDSCLANLKVDPVTWKPCIPSATLLNQADVPSENSLINLPSCLPCSMFTDSQLCEVNNCYWLNFNTSCSSTNVTEPITTTAVTATSSSLTPSVRSSNLSMILGLAIGIPLGLLLVLAEVGAGVIICKMCIRWNKKTCEPAQPRDVCDTPNPLYESIDEGDVPTGNAGSLASNRTDQSSSLSSTTPAVYVSHIQRDLRHISAVQVHWSSPTARFLASALASALASQSSWQLSLGLCFYGNAADVIRCQKFRHTTTYTRHQGAVTLRRSLSKMAQILQQQLATKMKVS